MDVQMKHNDEAKRWWWLIDHGGSTMVIRPWWIHHHGRSVDPPFTMSLTHAHRRSTLHHVTAICAGGSTDRRMYHGGSTNRPGSVDRSCNCHMCTLNRPQSIDPSVDQPNSLRESSMVDSSIYHGRSVDPPWLIRRSTMVDPSIHHGRSINIPHHCRSVDPP